MTPSTSNVKVVALGDSLTVGFQSYDVFGDMGKSTPYTDFLGDYVNRDFASCSLSAEIVNRGVVGEISAQMLDRFDSDVIRLSPNVVIILGGSNDLGWGLAPREIFLNLSRMYELSLENHITPIACTVPSVLGYDEGVPARLVLNKLLQDHCREIGIRCVDTFHATLEQSTNRLASEYSNDGLHLNSEGYRKMGAAIYEEGLYPILREMVQCGVPRGNG